jgi:dTDP-glucose pyrophosphorylase
VLPIDGRAVIATLLRELAAAGCGHVVVVTGHLAEQVERLVGDGSGLGPAVSFIRQPEPLGSADAARHGLEVARPPVIVTGADTVFQRGDVARFAGTFEGSGAAAAIGVRREPPPEPPHRFAVRVLDGRVTRVLDDDPENPLGGAPLWALGPAAAERVAEACAPPFEPPYELSAALQLAIDADERVAAVEIGATRDLTNPLDLVTENFPYLSP